VSDILYQNKKMSGFWIQQVVLVVVAVVLVLVVPRDGPATAARQLRLLLDSYRFEKRSGVFKTYGFIATELSRTTVLGQSWRGGLQDLQT